MRQSIGVTPGVTYTYTVGAGGSPARHPGTQAAPRAISSFTGDTVTLFADGGAAGTGGDNSGGGAAGRRVPAATRAARAGTGRRARPSR